MCILRCTPCIIALPPEKDPWISASEHSVWYSLPAAFWDKKLQWFWRVEKLILQSMTASRTTSLRTIYIGPIFVRIFKHLTQLLQKAVHRMAPPNVLNRSLFEKGYQTRVELEAKGKPWITYCFDGSVQFFNKFVMLKKKVTKKNSRAVEPQNKWYSAPPRLDSFSDGIKIRGPQELPQQVWLETCPQQNANKLPMFFHKKRITKMIKYELSCWVMVLVIFAALKCRRRVRSVSVSRTNRAARRGEIGEALCKISNATR